MDNKDNQKGNKPFHINLGKLIPRKPRPEELISFEDELARRLFVVPMRPPGLLFSKN